MASGWALRIGSGKAANSCGLHRRVAGQLRSSIASCSASLALDSTHRELGPGQAAPVLPAAKQFLAVGQALGPAVEAAAVLEHLDQPHLPGKAARPAGLGDRQRQRLQPVVLEHQLGDFVGHPRQQRVALASLSSPSRISRLERDLDVDLVVRAIDPGRIVDEVGVDAPAVQRELDARRPG